MDRNRQTARRRRTSWIGLAAGGVLFAAGGTMHPRVEKDLGLDEALAGMMSDGAWVPAHGLSLVAALVLGASLLALLRGGAFDHHRRLRASAWVALAGAGAAALELVPHLLAETEAEALVSGGSTPLTDLHLVLQAIATPTFGLGFAALAVVGASRGALGNRVLAVPGVVGGLAWAAAGPAIVLSEQPGFAPLFMGGLGVAIWVVAVGVSGYRGEARLQGNPAAAVATA